MLPSEYVQLAIRTESTKNEPWPERLYHSAIGCCTETGELMDHVKRHAFYNKPIDKIEAAKELGDILWYVAIGCSALGITMESVMEANIAKLRARYPDKYTDDKAINRDTVKEDQAADSLLEIKDLVGLTHDVTFPPCGHRHGYYHCTETYCGYGIVYCPYPGMHAADCNCLGDGGPR